METLDTYNRVRSLESPFRRLLLSIIYLFFLTIFVAVAIWFVLSKDSGFYPIYALLITFVFFISFRVYCLRRKLRCQFCNNELSESIRPFLFTTKYLAMRGLKEGNYFYTLRAKPYNPFNKPWVKICNRSLTCHHCRLTEEKHYEYAEEVSPEEVGAIQHTQQD